jgi:hypothetical protein
MRFGQKKLTIYVFLTKKGGQRALLRRVLNDVQKNRNTFLVVS